MNNKKMEKDLKSLIKIDYSRINITDTLEEMTNSVHRQHAVVIDKRMKMALRALLSKDDATKALELIRTKNKQVLGLFLSERFIKLVAEEKQDSDNPFSTYLKVGVAYGLNTKNPSKIDLSYIEESEFRKQLKELKMINQ